MKGESKKNVLVQSQEKLTKLVFLICGNDGVGKKSIVNEWKKKMKFEKEEDKSFYKVYSFTLNHRTDDISLSINLEIRVLNGDEIETDLKINMPFYKNAFAAFVVADVNEYITFQDGIKWKEKIDLLCCLPNRFPLPSYLLMNKCDLLEKEKRQPWMAENKIEEYFSENQFMKHYFISTKENNESNRGSNVSATSSVDIEIPIKDAVKFIMDFKDLRNEFIESHKSNNVNLTQINELKKKKEKKCIIY